MKILLSLIIFGLLSLVKAHGGVRNYTVGDGDSAVWYRGYDPDYPPEWQDAQPWLTQRKWATNNPIFQPDNVSVACNWPGDPAPSSIPIQAGQNFSGVYYYWQHTYGPMLIWMADCGGDCTTFDATKGKWFKLREDGLMSGTIRDGAWFQQLWADHWDGEPDYYGITIPVNIKPGNYLIRHEIIAIHSENKPQFYPECVHVKVSGDGTAVPGEEYYTSIPGVWSMDQPEINIDVYSDENANKTIYNIPGPPVWTG